MRYFWPNSPKKIVLWVFALTVLVVFGMLSDASKQDENPDYQQQVQAYKKNLRSEAIAYAQVEVNQKLKSPGSASHAVLPEDKVEMLNDSTYVVLNYVDSQNDFGTLKRTYYKCWMVYNEITQKWRCENVQFESK